MENSFKLLIILIHIRCYNVVSFQIIYIFEMSSAHESDSDEEERSKERNVMKLLDMVTKELERYCKVAEENTKMDEIVRSTNKEVIDSGKESCRIIW